MLDAGDMAAKLQPLAAEFMRGSASDASSVRVIMATTSAIQDWRADLGKAVQNVQEGDVLIVLVVNPSLARRVLRASSRAQVAPLGPGPRMVCRALSEMGFLAVPSYRIWPSAEAIRLITPWQGVRVRSYLRRAGVLGGGGQCLSGRVVARSLVATPLINTLTPAVVVMARKGSAGK